MRSGFSYDYEIIASSIYDLPHINIEVMPYSRTTRHPLRLVVGVLVLAEVLESPAVDPIAIFSGRLPSSEACFALAGLFQ